MVHCCALRCHRHPIYDNVVLRKGSGELDSTRMRSAALAVCACTMLLHHEFARTCAQCRQCGGVATCRTRESARRDLMRTPRFRRTLKIVDLFNLCRNSGVAPAQAELQEAARNSNGESSDEDDPLRDAFSRCAQLRLALPRAMNAVKMMTASSCTVRAL